MDQERQERHEVDATAMLLVRRRRRAASDSRACYNLASFLRTLALPETVSHWSLTSLREKPVTIGAKFVTHARYVTFQMAEFVTPKELS
jgi:hypothetical protein